MAAELPRYPRIDARLRTGQEPFHTNGKPLAQDLLSFWSWACSDLNGNALRGLLGEYLVSIAVGADRLTRVEWDACDIIAPSGTRIEVKTSAYLQSWEQRRLSTIEFSIGPRRAWEAATNVYSANPCRAADIYVFAVHKHQEQASLDPLDVDQWTFHVVPTSMLNALVPEQKTIRLSALLRLGAVPVSFSDLTKAIADATTR